jgi:TonB family protein
LPACEYCPQSEYTDEAVKAKLQGTVYLAVAIDASGAAKQIYVVEGLPFGLTQKAVDSVRSWRFKPALDPDGKPVEVAQIVEIQFRLF